jgi:hypothetical protein
MSEQQLFNGRLGQYTQALGLIVLALFLLWIACPMFTATMFTGCMAPLVAVYLGMIGHLVSHDSLFKQLFKEFNERYDAMNEKLGQLEHEQTRDAVHSRKARESVVDYLNLCAEEYLWYKKGRIDEEVWTAWLAGMKEKLAVPFIREVFDSEVNNAGTSYYGFVEYIKPLLPAPSLS